LELLLVVGILVMLAAFALPSFMGTQKQAQIDSVTAQIALFEDALRLYQSQNNVFPTAEQGLQALMEKPEEDPIPKRWAGPYLTEATVLDPWGNEYRYSYPGEHNKDKKPDIWSVGPDGEDGSEDDIGNWKADGEDKEDTTADKSSAVKPKTRERKATK
jgi:general secretion pathway protein G